MLIIALARDATPNGGGKSWSADLERMRGFVTDVPLGDEVLRGLGRRVVRFGNDEVVRNATRSAVVGKIREFVENEKSDPL